MHCMVSSSFAFSAQVEPVKMKASSRGDLAPWIRLRASPGEGARRRETTPDQLPDDGDLLHLALWNACATNPISSCALSASVVDTTKREYYKSTMCNQGSPGRRTMVDADEDENSRSAWEESLWTPGKPALRFCSLIRRRKEEGIPCGPLLHPPLHQHYHQLRCEMDGRMD